MPRALLAVLLLSAACATVGDPALQDSKLAYTDRVFQRFIDRYYQGYFDFRPGEATDDGFHDRDGKMPDLSRGAISHEVLRLRAALAELDGMSPADLTDADRVDRELLLSSIQAELLDLTEIRSWERQPSYYNDRVAWSIFGLVKRDFAPLADRLADVVSRERAVPAILADAEANLKNPPKLWVDIAQEDAEGTLSFLTQDVPAAFAKVDDAGLQAQLRDATDRAAEAYRGYLDFLKNDLAARADGDFRLGEDVYRKKLLYEEGIDLPIDRLIEIGEGELARQQANIVSTANQIEPGAGPAAVLAKLTKDHPAADQLLAQTQALLASLRDFCEQHHIVGLPSQQLPTVAETPPFARAFTFASMDTPGPFETKATEAYFYETLPEKSWPAQRIEEHLEAYWRGDIANTAIHEAYPGHYVQFLWLPKSPTKVRKLVAANSFIEGWAHYGEEMLLEEGYGGNDPKLWISEEQWGLVRACRYLVGLRMHTRGMTLDEAVAFFEKNAYLNHANALREAQRGTADPTYLVYTLGKLEILKLRHDYQEKLGAAYTLEGFHDALLSLGYPPIPVARELLLGEVGQPL
ncbi:MAG TPA: DUF885 domain-containing protein [Myxococcales bacterium]|nr:DUF885 domain-containing protein [Myxococcales bacterium]